MPRTEIAAPRKRRKEQQKQDASGCGLAYLDIKCIPNTPQEENMSMLLNKHRRST
jgi:hypothetical protein